MGCGLWGDKPRHRESNENLKKAAANWVVIGKKMEADQGYIKKLVRERLHAMPPDVSFSVGDFGDYTRDELIDEVEKETTVGKAAIEMQINFIRKMPRLLSQ